MIRDHYSALGISPRATAEEILKARNRLLLAHHPDHNPHEPDAAKETTIHIILAAEVLLDQHQRAEYDAMYERVYGGAVLDHSPYLRDFERADIVVCAACSRPNADTGRGYCIFCGAGIGEAPAPFSAQDLNAFLPHYSQSILSFTTLDRGCAAWVIATGLVLAIGAASLFALRRLAARYIEPMSDAWIAFMFGVLAVFAIGSVFVGYWVTHKITDK